MTVEHVRVGEVLRLERRPMQVDAYVEYVEVGVRSFGRGIFHKEPVDGASLGTKRVFHVEPNDLVIRNVFAWEGAIAVASENEAGTIGSHRFMTFVPTDDRIDIRWAAWFFRCEPGLVLIRKASPGSAGRNRTLAIDRFEGLQIPLPAIGEQRRVAARLDRVETGSEELLAKLDLASSLASALTASVVLRSDMEASEKQAIGWERVALGEVLTERIHATPVQADGTYRVAGVYSFGRGIFERGRLDGTATSYRALHRLRAGQVVLSRLKAWEGAIAVVPGEYDGYFLSPEFPTFDIDVAKADTAYLGAVLMTRQFWSSLAAASRGIGARRERVHSARLLEQQVDLPPLETQRAIAKALSAVHGIDARHAGARKRVDALVPAALNETFARFS